MAAASARGPRRDQLVRLGLRELGWALIALGVLALLFAAYVVWATGLLEARSQATLRRGFESAIAEHRQAALAARSRGRERLERSRWATSSAAGGRAIDELRIPAIGLDALVVDGVSEEDLALGPGHYPGTALPGQAGNAAIAGHRTTYGAPFYSLDALRVGERVLVTDRFAHRYVYRVARTPFVVSPRNVAVLAPTTIAELTLTTCTPRYWATSRLVVVARLVGRPAAASRSTLEASLERLGPVAPASSSTSSLELSLWAGLVAVLWLAIRGTARAWKGRVRLLGIGMAVAAEALVLWFAFGSLAGTLSPTS